MFKVRNKLLSSIALGGLIYVNSMAPLPANAGLTSLLQPNSSWAVSKIKPAQGDAYCALARRFNNDMVITLAQNIMNENSLALDFQKEVLDNNKTYRVTLSPGSGQNREFDIRPVSGRALVAKLGKDPSFYEALSKGRRLDVDISGQAYSFNLPDFDAGQKDLTGCMNGLVKPVDSLVKPEVISDELKQANTSMTPADQVMGLPNVEDLQIENLRLRRALESERRMYEDGYMSRDTDSSIVAELSEKIKILEDENNILKTGATVPNRRDDTQQYTIAQLNEQILDLKSQNSRLKTSIKDSKPVKFMPAQNSESKNQLESDMAMVSSRNNQLNQQVSYLEAENNRLMGSIKALKQVEPDPAQNIEVRNKIKRLQSELAMEINDKERLKRELDDMRSRNEDGMINNISGDNWDLEVATRRYNEAEREMRRLGVLLQEDRASCMKEKQEIEYMLFDPEIAEKEQISKLIKLEEELNLANAALKAQKDTYEDQMAHLKRNGEQFTCDSGSEVAYLQSQIESLESEANENIRLLHSQLEKLEHDANEQIVYLQTQLGLSQASSPYGNYGGGEGIGSQPIEAERLTDLGTSMGSFIEKPLNNDITSDHTKRHELVALQPQLEQQSKPTTIMDGLEIESFLKSAGVKIVGRVNKVQSVSGGDFVAHSWDTGNLFGSIEQHNMSINDGFDLLKGKYLRKTETRCSGDFAAIPSELRTKGSLQVEAVEVACIGQDESASASLLFFNRGDVFTIIAHETGMDGMDIAMDTRDNLINTIIQASAPSF